MSRAFARLWEPFRFLFHRRAVLFQLVRTDLQRRFRYSAIGLGWVAVQPILLVTVGVSAVLDPLRGRGIAGLDAWVFVASGMLPWLALNEGLSRAGGILHENTGLAKSPIGPVLLLPVAAVINALIPLVAVMPLLMAAGFLSARAAPRPHLLIAAFTMQVLFTFGGGWLMSAIGTIVPDARRALGPALYVLLAASPILYPAKAYPPSLEFLALFNPVAIQIGLYRAGLLLESAPPLPFVCAALAVSAALFIGGYRVFLRAQPYLREFL